MDLFDDLPPESSKMLGESKNGKGEKTQAPSSKENVKREAKEGEKRKLTDNEMPHTEPLKKKKPEDIINFKSFHAERQGERDEMQDACTLIEDYASQVSGLHESVKQMSYYAVFDGHGGARASKFAAENLHTILIDKLKGDITKVEKDIKKVFTESFKKTDEMFLRLASKSKPAWKDGTTAAVVLAINETLFVANLGDSKAVLCRYNDSLEKCVAIPLTKDHNPAQYEERVRIQKAKGFVEDGRVMGQLEVSRSIGDGQFKNHGVTCVPDIKKCQLTKHDKYVLVACDGLFKSFTNEAAIEFINNILNDGKIRVTEGQAAEDVKYEMACNKLANEAVLRLSADNVTIVLIRLDHPKT